jgi:hypothetical protein
MALAARPKVRRCEHCFSRLRAGESDLVHKYSGHCAANPPKTLREPKRKDRKRASDWDWLGF